MSDQNLITTLQTYAAKNDASLNCAIAKALLASTEQMNTLTIDQLSQLANCSKASIVRFCKTFEFDGYKEFHWNLLLQQKLAKTQKQPHSNNEFDKLTLYSKQIMENLTYLQETAFTNIIAASKAIKAADKIFLFGKGPNLWTCSVLSGYLQKLGYPVFTSTDLDIQAKLINNASKQSVAIFFTYSGQTPEVLKIYEKALEIKTTNIVITSNINSPICSKKNVNIISLMNEEILSGSRNCSISYLYVVMQIVNLLAV